MKEIIFLGRVYEFETDNEHLVTAFQQFIDQTSDAKDLRNGSEGMSFTKLIQRV